MFRSIKFAWKYRKAWFYTAVLRNKSRFSRTILGGYWFGISNLLSIALISLFYSVILQVPDRFNYILYMGMGMALWHSFSHSISSADMIIDANANKLNSFPINPIFYACESWVFELFNFLQTFSFVIIFLSLIRVKILLNIFIYSLPSILNFCLGMFWIPLIISIIVSRFRDLKQVIPVFLHFLFLTSPILYRAERIGKLAFLTNLNPIYKLISCLRDSIIDEKLFFVNNLIFLTINLIGIIVSVKFLDNQRYKLPFYT